MIASEVKTFEFHIVKLQKLVKFADNCVSNKSDKKPVKSAERSALGKSTQNNKVHAYINFEINFLEENSVARGDFNAGETRREITPL